MGSRGRGDENQGTGVRREEQGDGISTCMKEETVGKRRKGENEGQGRVGMEKEVRRGRAEKRGKVSSNWRK